MEGVRSVTSGYMGGRVVNPSYEAVCTGVTGHAEVVQVEFDPSITTFRDLLEVFFVIHDPTTLNRQGNDTGTQYRSAIFYHSDAQRETAEAIIRELGPSFPSPVVTQVVPGTEFFVAEEYHQNYYRTHPSQGYCSFVVAPKLAKFRDKFARKRKRSA